MTKCLMVQGTTSDAGKSTLVAGLCRVLVRKGVRVAPFKPQNMALNSAVTVDGGEIGRAQAVQAVACQLPPHTDMNPVLIKPSSDTGAQIIIQGHVNTNMTAQNFHRYKPEALRYVLESFQRLHTRYDTVVVEGAGSPAEINLRKGDIANMGFAEAADCPVILIADINPGGVFAHIIGTLELLSGSERDRIKGFVINRFRGDIALLQSGLDWLEEKTGKPVFGVLPYLHDFHIEAEDGINTEQSPPQEGAFNIVVPVLPRISNHTDFDALRHHPNVNLKFCDIRQPPPPADLIILPGSKNVRDDLAALQKNGWAETLQKHLRYGGKLMGICGGYQMLGETVNDPDGQEGAPGETKGFCLLPLKTTLKNQKQLHNTHGTLQLDNRTTAFNGYEIHQGETTRLTPLGTPPVTLFDNRYDGCISDDNQVFGCYIHGLFGTPATCDNLLHWAGLTPNNNRGAIDTEQLLDQQLNRLADVLEKHLDLQAIFPELETNISHPDETAHPCS
ncbi:cobyric acid synthase [Teredinibacter purpureus]|uniref:cobyric acid synthase n=1 Tax=Teredinibacter purpureus TaxID=2731756 RepID=UPI0005F79295|nr:cobyric acid synthase [Teredinibacter purpureus]